MSEAEISASAITVENKGGFLVWFYATDQTQSGANTSSTESFPVLQSKTIALGGTFIKEGNIVAPAVSAVGGIGANSQRLGVPIKYDPRAGAAVYTVEGTLFGWTVSGPKSA